jgi:hypothetical protein
MPKTLAFGIPGRIEDIPVWNFGKPGGSAVIPWPWPEISVDHDHGHGHGNTPRGLLVWVHALVAESPAVLGASAVWSCLSRDYGIRSFASRFASPVKPFQAGAGTILWMKRRTGADPMG